MKEVTTIGRDLAKNVFQVHGIDAAGAGTLRLEQILPFFAKPPRFAYGRSMSRSWSATQPVLTENLQA